MNPLFLNFLLYFFVLLYYIKCSKKKVNVHSFMLLIFTCVAFLGYYTFETGIYEDTFGRKNIDNLSYVPYLICFIIVLAICSPLRYLDIDRLIIKKIPSNKTLYKIVIILFLNIVLSTLLFSLTIKNRTAIDYAEVYAEGANGNLIITTGSNILDSIYGKTMLLTRISTPVFYFICFYMLMKQSSVKIVILLIFLFFSLQLPECILNANRGGMFFSSMYLCFFVILFYYHLSKPIKRFIFIFITVGLCLIIFYSLAITYARIGDDSDGLSSVLRYFGEPFPNLGFNIWDKEIRHPYGARFYPTLAELLGFKTLAAGTAGRNVGFEYWENYIGIPMLNFKTILGDLYIEFGTILTLFVIFIYVIILKHVVIRKKKSIFSVAYLFLPYKWALMCIFGFFFVERDILDLVAMMLLIHILNFINNNVQTRNRYTCL